MKMKALLLGTGAAVAFAGAQAQAADLSIAEPVDYVRVCDAFGTGYWYIPGTDTCLRIGGFVRFEARFDNNSETSEGHEDWDFFTRANLQVEARSMTDWGPLISYFEFEGDFNDTAADPTIEEAWLSLGPVTAGYTQSAFDWGGGYAGMFGLDDGYADGTAFTDNKLNQIQLSWAMNGFGLILAVEEGEARAQDWYDRDWIGSISGSGVDLVAAITGEGNDWNAKVAFLYADRDWGNDASWGVQGGIEFTDLFGTSDKFMLAASYVSDEVWAGWGDITSVMASYRHNWQSNLYSAINVRYDDYEFGGDNWSAAFQTTYTPVENFSVGAAVRYDNPSFGDDDWQFRIRLQRDFGG